MTRCSCGATTRLGLSYDSAERPTEQIDRGQAECLDEFDCPIGAAVLKPGGLELIVREYLSVRHRDNPDRGCPSAALLYEIGRCGKSTKHAYTDGVLAVIDAIAAQLAPDDPQSARAKTLSAFAMMVGTLQLSRALADRALADQILEQGVHDALALPTSAP